MTALFFVALVGVQTILALVGCAVAFVATATPSAKRYRERSIGAVIWGAPGGVAGAIAGYVTVLVSAWITCKALSTVSVSTTGCAFISAASLWLLAAGYLVGIVGAGLFGWRRAGTRKASVN